MTDILLINVHSSCNAGDQALTLVTIQQLERNFPDGQLVIAMDDPEGNVSEEPVVPSLYAWVKPTLRDGSSNWRFLRLAWLLPATLIPLLSRKAFGRPYWGLTPQALQPLIRGYLNSDLVVSTSGGFLYSSGLGLVFLISVYSMAYATFAGKPLYLFPQSYGPLHRFWEPYILRWLLNRARVVMAREEISFDLVNSLVEEKSRCLLFPDPAFAFSGSPPESAENWLTGLMTHGFPGRPLLGVTVINWTAENPVFQQQTAYERAVAAAVRNFIERYGGSVIFFTQVWGPSYSQDDRLPSRRVIAGLQEVSDHIHHIEEPITPGLLKSIYGCMDLFMGTRMHSNIFALSQGVPVLAIGYQHKTQGIMRMLGLDDWTVDIQQVDGPGLCELLDELWLHRPALGEQLRAALPKIVKEAGRPGAIVAQDFLVNVGKG